MNKRKLGSFALSAMLFAFCISAQAREVGKVPRIGWLGSVPMPGVPERQEHFRRGLRELGYIEGKNIVIEWRSSEGILDRNSALADELVRLKVDVIVSAAASLTRAAKAATSTVPIVMAQDSDPVGNGFVASLARPGGNITGLSTLAPELSGKKLEILKEVVPTLSRVAVFETSTYRDTTSKEIELAAQVLKIKIQYLDVRSPTEFERAFREAVKGRADAVLMEVAGPVNIPHRKKTPELAAKNRLPVMYRRAQDVEAGGLMTYGVDLNDLDRRAAVYVDKILKGAKPADLPIEQPRKFEFFVNLKAAKQIGLTIPQSVLYRADNIIK